MGKMTVKILYGFDTERPYGPTSKTEEGKKEMEENTDLVARLNALMDSHGAGRTFFLLGAHLDEAVEQLGAERVREALQPSNPLVEIAQHTYNHPTIANIKTRPDKKPITAEQLVEELRKADEAINRHLSAKAVGLRTPLGYAKGLQEHAAVLDALKGSGLIYVSASLRDKEWGINAPLVEDGEIRQPFVYSNGLVEVPSHGWQDTAFTGTSKTVGTENYPTTIDGIFEHYRDIALEAERISKEGGKIVCVGLCMHPWAMRIYDPKLEVVKRLLDFSAEHGIEGAKYLDATKDAKLI
jgi:peptidoglycan/xylan/chitin deacetylase (PgdA/CDA1 family)